jgi:hypothetical protein
MRYKRHLNIVVFEEIIYACFLVNSWKQNDGFGDKWLILYTSKALYAKVDPASARRGRTPWFEIIKNNLYMIIILNLKEKHLYL